MYEPAPIKPRKRVPLREADPYRFWGRWRGGLLVGVVIGLTFYFFSRPVMARNPTAGWIMRGIALLAPVLGVLMHDTIDALVDRGFRNIFWPQGKDTAPAHSQGESLVQRQLYAEAIEWFTTRVLESPGDWRAQSRLVELLDEHGNDPDRLVEERIRLIKMEGVAPALWIQAVFDQAKLWEESGKGERAVHLYQSVLWKYPEDEAAEDAGRNIERLRKTGLA